MKIDESKLRQYLLKNLSEDETETIDLRILQDDELESSLAFAEEDLLEDYADDMLSAHERELFLNNFLVSARRREHLAFLIQIKIEAAQNSFVETPATPSLSEKLAKLFRPGFPQIAVFAALLIVFAIFAWRFILIDQSAGEIAALNKADLSDLTAYQKSSNLTLTTDVLRGNNAEKTLRKDSLTENVLLRLDLRENAETIPLLKIYRGENRIETLENARVYKTQNGAEIRLLIPSAKLEKGAYRVEFEIENRKTIYNFTIQ